MKRYLLSVDTLFGVKKFRLRFNIESIDKLIINIYIRHILDY